MSQQWLHTCTIHKPKGFWMNFWKMLCTTTSSHMLYISNFSHHPNMWMWYDCFYYRNSLLTNVPSPTFLTSSYNTPVGDCWPCCTSLLWIDSNETKLPSINIMTLSFYTIALCMVINLFMQDCNWLIEAMVSSSFWSTSFFFWSTTPFQFNIPSTLLKIYRSINNLLRMSYIQ